MATTKWTNLGAGRIQCKRFNDAWSKLNWENNTYTELTGVIGVSESSSTLTALFGGNMREDVTAVKEKIGQRYNWEITAQNAAEIVKAIEAELPALKAGRPVKDQRRTPEVENQRNEEYRQSVSEQAERSKREHESFVRLYGTPGRTWTIQPGQMAVTARICYDNSDMMTDYYQPHASLSPRFALLIVPKQAETEKLARRAVEQSPIVSGLTLEWKTEKYSMGHGNYLISKGFELPPEVQGLRQHYSGGGPVNFGHWEIEFEYSYGKPIEIPVLRPYLAAQEPQPGDAEYEALKAKIAALESSADAARS